MSDATSCCHAGSAPALTAAARGRRRPGRAWLEFLARMVAAIETRRQLAAMDDRMLSDIGISRAEALREAERRPWDLVPPPRPPWRGR
jgi:uncharacterized protein YjiS (DUF1127 family)